MIVVVNPSSKAGHSFKGLHAYCSHDQQRAQTSERVDWISTRNMAVEDPAQAWKVMTATAYAQNQLKQNNGIRTGPAPKDGAVMHLVMSFDADEPTSPEDMQAAADDLLANLGADPGKMRAKNKPSRRQFADEHQAIMYAHTDTDNPHLHLMINRVHPQTGIVLPTNNDHNKAQAWALAYSKRHGTDHKTPARAENDEMRKDGEYVKANKRKTRNAFEQEQAAREASNDNHHLAKVLEQQRAKDADLQKRGRELREKQAQGFTKLIEAHKQRKADLGRQLQVQINKAKAQQREDLRPLKRELRAQQLAEQKTFDSMEASFMGRAANAFKLLVARSEDIGGNRRGFNIKRFKSAVDAGERKAAFEAAQNRAMRALELDSAAKASKAVETLKTAQRASLAKNRTRLEDERAELKKRHAEAEQKLKSEWKARAAERARAIADVPPPAPKKTEFKDRARLAHVRTDYRVQFDAARQKPAVEQDNSGGNTQGDDDKGRAVAPSVKQSPPPSPEPAKSPEPPKPAAKSYAEMQRENAAAAADKKKDRGNPDR